MNWFQVVGALLKSVMTTELNVKGWYSEHLGVCRRMELLRKTAKVKKVSEVAGGLIRDLKVKAKYFVLDSLVRRRPEKKTDMWAGLGFQRISVAVLLWTFRSFERRYVGQLMDSNCLHQGNPAVTTPQPK